MCTKFTSYSTFVNWINLKYFSIIILLYLSLISCNNNTETTEPIIVTPVSISTPASDFTADIALDWQSLHLELIKTTPNFAPPIAARSLAFVNLALYESVVNGTSNRSLGGQLSELKTLPAADPTQKYNWGLVANVAQYTLIRELFDSTSTENKTKISALRVKYETLFATNETQEIIDRSIRYGADIATAIWDYAKTDGAYQAFNNLYPKDYVVPKGLGNWVPTSNQLIPLLPYWRDTRSFVEINRYTNPLLPLQFSYRKNSDFFKEADEIYNMSLNQTPEEITIANYWGDAAGSFTPPGHHMNIVSILVAEKKLTLDQAAEIYCKAGLAMHDAFISCWKAKYRFNLIRPETYIRETLDKNWKPLLKTPPFPEYTSGHSTSAGAAAEVLADYFGENTSFIDKTNEGTYANRVFSSFSDYANEASVSRMYGGIHFRRGCEEGVANGRAIARNVLKLKFK